MAKTPIVLKDFQNAVADSPNLGHALMRNIDIESFPGAMKVQKKVLSMANLATTRTFTADAGTDVCTASGDVRTQAQIDNGTNFNAAAVQFTTTGTLPAGLSLATNYFLIYASSTTFKVATSYANAIAGTAIDITDAGTGTHTMTAVAMGTVRTLIKDPRTGYLFASDSNGRVWHTRGGTTMYLLNGNTLTGGEGKGMALFRTSDGTATYLFVFRNATIDVINVYGNTELDSPSWTTGWQSLNSGAGSGNSHFSLVGQDNIIYFCDGRYVGSIQERAGSVFAPGSAATYTYNNQALTMPQAEITQCLEELGLNLLIGGVTFNKIYPWDRSSVSYTLPLFVPENGVYQMKNLGSTVYIFAGTKGNIYTTQGTYVRFFRAIPGYIVNNAGTLQSNPLTWGGVAVRNGAIIFGLSSLVSGNSGTYILYPDGRILQDNTPYAGSTNVTAIYADNDFYYTGYSGGMDYSDTNRYAAGTFAAVYQSAQYRVAGKVEKAAYSELEVKMAKPASTGQIRVGWRADTSSSFTTIATFTCDGSVTSFKEDAGLTDLENVQVQVEFDGTVEIMEVSLIP